LASVKRGSGSVPPGSSRSAILPRNGGRGSLGGVWLLGTGPV
jgi:hypothetical protein